jgi:hypothetical protein
MHGWDFDRYWFEPLGQLFGVSEKQIDDLATEIIISDWKVKIDGSYNSEPRDIFRKYSYNDETQHSHGDYPQAEEYRFYLSYHALFVVASNLLANMPLVYSGYDKKFEGWNNWLHYCTLTYSNGKWISDRRDEVPLLPYLNFSIILDEKKWRNEYIENDFINRLILKKDSKFWINIYAYWEENNNRLRERVHITTALVSPDTAQSLLFAWNSFDNPHDYKLPEYDEKEMEIDRNPFILKGYVSQSYKYSGIDNYDPFTEDLDYPPYQLGEPFIQILSLTPDVDQRFWYEPQNDIPVMECRIWNSGKNERSEISRSNGKYLSISLAMLKKLCIKTRMEIIFKVEIERKNTQEEKFSYGKEKKRQTRLYLFSADGKFRDARTYYKFG